MTGGRGMRGAGDDADAHDNHGGGNGSSHDGRDADQAEGPAEDPAKVKDTDAEAGPLGWVTGLPVVGPRLAPAVRWVLDSHPWRSYERMLRVHWTRLAAAITFTSFVALFPC